MRNLMLNKNRTQQRPVAPGRPNRSALLKWLPVAVITFAFLAAPFAAPATEILAGPSDDELVAGAEVYTTACASCHQAGGVGVPGQFPPLINNPSVDDTDYVEQVIRGGLSGEVVVNGQTFDGVMPAQSTMSDHDVASVIAYVQSGFAVPEAPAAEFAADSSDGSGLSDGARRAIYIGLALAVVVGAFVFSPRIIAVNDPREIRWSDAWMKSGVLVVGLILATTMLPVWAWESGTLQDLTDTQRDLITVGVWSAGLGGSLFALWYLHRKNRI